MKFNVSYPTNGTNKLIEIVDNNILSNLYGLRISNEFDGELLGNQYSGYIFKISGGNDKQGFPMKQGVLTATRVRLLLTKGMSCYRPRRKGERKRKSVRGCIVGPDLATLNLVVVRKGDADIPGLTDSSVPKRLGPKRASKIRKLFDLKKEDDVRKYVFVRKFEKNGKTVYKSPKIQRLVTPLTLQRKRRQMALKRKARAKAKREEQEYSKLYQQRMKEQKERRASEISKRRSRRSKQAEKA